MNNGRNLIDMVCEAFESDVGPGSGGSDGLEQDDDDELFNFSEGERLHASGSPGSSREWGIC